MTIARFMSGERRADRRSPRWPVVLAFVGPAVLLYGVIFLYPVGAALTNGFFSWAGSVRKDFVGIDNFVALMGLEPYAGQFLRAIGNNVVFFFGTMIVQNGVGLVLAFLIHGIVRGKRFFQTVISIPYLMSALVIGYAWSMLLSPRFGAINAVLGFFGVEPVAWLGTPALIMPILILINAWQWIGVTMLIFGAGLTAIPADQIEAARVDGASSFRIAWSIQLPQLVSSVSIVTVLTLIGCFNLFDLVFAIGGSAGGVSGAADVMGTLFYRLSFSNSPNAFGLSGAFSLVQLVLILVVTIGIQRFFRRVERRYS
ncbi:sugar ABC transporter permease [Microbacterium resistens]|uniref:carbohydrate ABC transporter permease n=1 Tax=Microbacterium resistens TaxID=156977 RepID=UPI001C56BD19|nr:sugar ABC transporter permease [Microbacterium resistens]MBW1639590.1 sugar ABC transporter permease [Microbacterium resistens]